MAAVRVERLALRLAAPAALREQAGALRERAESVFVPALLRALLERLERIHGPDAVVRVAALRLRLRMPAGGLAATAWIERVSEDLAQQVQAWIERAPAADDPATAVAPAQVFRDTAHLHAVRLLASARGQPGPAGAVEDFAAVWQEIGASPAAIVEAVLLRLAQTDGAQAVPARWTLPQLRQALERSPAHAPVRWRRALQRELQVRESARLPEAHPVTDGGAATAPTVQRNGAAPPAAPHRASLSAPPEPSGEAAPASIATWEHALAVVAAPSAGERAPLSDLVVRAAHPLGPAAATTRERAAAVAPARDDRGPGAASGTPRAASEPRVPLAPRQPVVTGAAHAARNAQSPPAPHSSVGETASWRSDWCGLLYLLNIGLRLELPERLWQVGVSEGDALAAMLARIAGTSEDPAVRLLSPAFPALPAPLPPLADWAREELVDGVAAAALRWPALRPRHAALRSRAGELQAWLGAGPAFDLPAWAGAWHLAIAAMLLDEERLGPDALARRFAGAGTIFDEGDTLRVVQPMDRIDLSMRRAALDADPGWLPWLRKRLVFAFEGAEALEP